MPDSVKWQHLRAALAANVADTEMLLSRVTGDALRNWLKQAQSWLQQAEQQLAESSKISDLAQRERLFGRTEAMIKVASEAIRNVEDLVAKYGTNARMMGTP